MITLPAPSQAVIASIPIPTSLLRLPDNFILRAVVECVAEYPGLVPDLNKAQKWAAFRAFIGERCDALKITQSYIRLYENDEYPARLMFQFSFIPEFKEVLVARAEELGFGDIIQKRVEEIAPERLRELMQTVVGDELQGALAEISEISDWDRIEAESAHYWTNVHPTLSLEEQQRAERDAQVGTSLFLYTLHNAISVMAYGESLSSLVQRAISCVGNGQADRAMCAAVRVDNNLREHPAFRERHLRATRDCDGEFLRDYNNISPPLSGGIRYRALYFLFAALDSFGLLDDLSNRQLLELCDHAKLDRWGNRIEDEGYLCKRRIEYRKRKFTQMSMHSH